MRFATGKLNKRAVGEKRILLPVIAIAIRGTEIECSTEPDGSGFVKLYSGVAEITPLKGGASIALEAGKLVEFDGTGKFFVPRTF